MKTSIKRLRYYLALGFGAVLVFSSLLVVAPSTQQTASAAPQADTGSCNWVDFATITCSGGSLPAVTYSGPYPGTETDFVMYRSTGPVSKPCTDKSFMEFDHNPTVPGAKADKAFFDLYWGYTLDVGGGQSGSDCVHVPNIPTPLGHVELSKLSKAQAICGIPDNPRQADQVTKCLASEAVKICGTGNTQAVQDCINLQKNGPGASGASLNLPPGFEGEGDEADPELDCGTENSRLNWIICPVVKLVNLAVNGLDNAITALLSVDPRVVNENSADYGARYYRAWKSFRTIALGLLVIAALIMIIGQVLGFEVLDAYTLKKVLPRFIIAIIGIALSWELMKWFVLMTNALGFGVRHIIYLPFVKLDDKSILSGGTGVLISLLSVGTILALGIGILLSFAATALLGLLIAFLVLIIRQLVIVVLILFAPVAIACYVLPNTQGVWKLWHESFTKALLMFPIIMAFLATGRVFALVSSGPTAGVAGQLIAFVAYIIPYFLIPLTFRFAGGALRTLGGFVNDRSSGVFDGLKKGRAAMRKERLTRARNNQLYDPNGVLGKTGFNSLASAITSPGSNAAYYGRKIPGLRKAGAKVAGQVEHARVAQSDKLVEELQKAGYNDKAYRFLSGSHEYTDAEGNRKSRFTDGVTRELKKNNLYNRAPQTLQEMQTAAHIFGQYGNETETIASTALEGSAGRLATLYQDPEMGKASIAAAGLIGLASHGFADGQDLANVGNKLQGSKGQDRSFASTVVSHAQLAGGRGRPDIKAGYGYVYKDGQFVSGVSAEGGRAGALLETLSAQDMAGAKGGAFDAMSPAITDALSGEGATSRLSPTATDAEILAARKAENKATAVTDQLFQWASPYSSSSNDIKARALGYIQGHGLEAAYKRRAEAEAATRARTGVSGGGDAGGDGGAGAGGAGGE